MVGPNQFWMHTLDSCTLIAICAIDLVSTGDTSLPWLGLPLVRDPDLKRRFQPWSQVACWNSRCAILKISEIKLLEWRFCTIACILWVGNRSMYSAYIKHFFSTQHRLSLFCEVVGASRYSYVNLNVLQKHIKILQGHDMIPCTRCYMKSGLPRSCLDAFFLGQEMGIADKCKLITMPFPPRMFAPWHFGRKNARKP